MLDLFGPASAPGSVTVRPGDTRSFGAFDTFFRDCSSPTLDDGTEFQAAWFNQILAALRALTRGNGSTGGGASVVTEDNAADDLLLKAVMHLIQRGQPVYGEDTSSTAGIITAALVPAPAEYKKGMTVAIKAANISGAGTVINLNGLGNVVVIRPDGTPLRDGDVWSGSVNSYRFDGTYFQLIGADSIPALKRNVMYYVNAATGSDTNDGTSATITGGHGPFATLQKAADTAALYNLNGFNITINVADGAGYAGVILPAIAGSGTVQFVGNVATPDNCVIAGLNKSAIGAYSNGGSYSFDGFRLQSSGTNPTDNMCGVNASGTVQILLGAITFGSCLGAHIAATQNAIVTNLSAGAPWRIVGGCAGSPNLSGSFLTAYNGGRYQTNPAGGPAITIPAAISYAGSFVESTNMSFAQFLYQSLTGGGNVTGKRFNVNVNAVINSGGGGANYYPGTVAGVIGGNGGQYI